ncbi:hypothetical protein MMC11_006300 [Xylographa trunciseda]|nr:hypothetical protein [Xylographa trunciseda]
MPHSRHLASMICKTCLFVILPTIAYAVTEPTQSPITPMSSIADSLPTTTASKEYDKCTPSIGILGHALSLVDEPIDDLHDPNDWPLLFTETSTHFCYTEEVTVFTLPHADNPTASPILATGTISEALFPNTTSVIFNSLPVEANDDIDNKRTTTTRFVQRPSVTHRSATAALSPTARGSFSTFAVSITAILVGKWSVLPAALLAFSLGVHSESIASEQNKGLIIPDIDADPPPVQNGERGIPAAQIAVTAQLLTSTTTISNIFTTTRTSTVTVANIPCSTHLAVDERSAGAVAAGGALIAIATAGNAAPPASPTAPTPLLGLVSFIATIALGPWGMLPVALVLLGLGVNGENDGIYIVPTGSGAGWNSLSTAAKVRVYIAGVVAFGLAVAIVHYLGRRGR